ncbi:unnamed protein product [Rhodiola kirilowii]
MLNWAKRVGLENGIVVVIKNSAKKSGGKMPKCILACERGGKYRPETSHMIDRFLDMADPSQSTVRVPSYNVELLHQTMTTLDFRVLRDNERMEIVIGHVGNHFVQLFLHPYHPVPPIPTWWWNHSSYEAKGWASSYQVRADLWREITSMGPPGAQFGGNID